jgi:hypothetical protein
MEELHEDLRNSVAHGGEENLFAIGRKAQAIFGSQAGLGEAVRFAAGKRNNPKVRLLGVLGKRDLNGREGNPAAIGREREVSNTLEIHHVLKGEGALLGNGRERDEQDTGNEQTTQHSGLSRAGTEEFTAGGRVGDRA